jgi:hypothetical protein
MACLFFRSSDSTACHSPLPSAARQLNAIAGVKHSAESSATGGGECVTVFGTLLIFRELGYRLERGTSAPPAIAPSGRATTDLEVRRTEI